MTPVQKKVGVTVLSLLVMALAARIWLGSRSQPQLPASAEVFTTVDALFTAVTAHDQHQLTACEQRLDKYKTAGTLPASAAKKLNTVISSARAGQWESAGQRLYAFMLGQRREGIEIKSDAHLAAATSSGRHTALRPKQ
jgi:hypothetical protein